MNSLTQAPSTTTVNPRFCLAALAVLSLAALPGYAGDTCQRIPLPGVQNVADAAWQGGRVYLSDVQQGIHEVTRTGFMKTKRGLGTTSLAAPQAFKPLPEGFPGDPALVGGFYGLEIINEDEPGAAMDSRRKKRFLRMTWYASDLTPLDHLDLRAQPGGAEVLPQTGSLPVHTLTSNGYLFGYGAVQMIDADGPTGDLDAGFILQRVAPEVGTAQILFREEGKTGFNVGLFHRYYYMGLDLVTSIGPDVYFVDALSGYAQLSRYSTETGLVTSEKSERYRPLRHFPGDNQVLDPLTASGDVDRINQIRSFPVALVTKKGEDGVSYLYTVYREQFSNSDHSSFVVYKMLPKESEVEILGSVRLPIDRLVHTVTPVVSPRFWYFVEKTYGRDDEAPEFAVLEMPAAWVEGASSVLGSKAYFTRVCE